ncbi:2,3-bisphosphoglycerate-independent phosphoglycerate mutase [Candidatus Chromulinivorax destructor]|uniref:2,3-bisphosphoglycerate-independent phosphoglycerate mutase n=2 Tax=Candidatus Chromulinivorax destructor TaxID=2066483 RepID=A0A345ZBH1_9BACT|nr:2,3-bisphosphoglycerate-independent phosphoglycerate mutase [Candidatus Chromulinivorax destructor]
MNIKHLRINMSSAPVNILIILDGLGISEQNYYNAFFKASTPHLDRWKFEHSYTTLQAAGTFVGLPDGYNGNSEVGHFALGSGRIMKQTSTLLNHSMQQSILQNSDIIANLLKKFNTNRTVHLLGLASNGNIHSNIDHLKALIFVLKSHDITNILVHAILDGRDTAPQSAQQFLDAIATDLEKYKCGKIASIHGRFYAMDRNNNMDRTQASFSILTQEQTSKTSYTDKINQSYDQNITDEFIQPTACIENHTIQQGDGVIFFNFRPDRAIQLTQKILELDLSFFVTPVLYHASLATTPLITAAKADNTLLEVISAHNKSIFTIAETEKYAHVTYFFNGHKDIRLQGEVRVLVPSLTDADIKKNPCMQAEKITAHVLESLHTNPSDFYLINYANADMIGHSGNLDATIAAIECLDRELGQLYEEVVTKRNGIMYITADHGNAEVMHDTITAQPCTSHTSNPVPFYMLSSNNKEDLTLTSLADVAPFILENMNITVPDEMKK